jgi:NitT/TauT family transport system permease protein
VSGGTNLISPEVPSGSLAGGRAPTASASSRRRLLRLYGEPSRFAYVTLAIASLAAILLLWWVAASLHLANSLFLPSPARVWHRALELARSGTLLDDTQTSFVRITIGFLISTAVALPIGILTGAYRLAEAAIEPAVDFIRYMPAVAFVPLTIIWVGVGESQKYLIIFIGTFFQQVLLVMDNVRRVPREFVDVGQTLGMRDRSILLRIVLPSAAPAIWDSLRVTLGWAWTWLVVAELVAASSGLGYRIVIAQRYFETDTIFVAILVIGLLGLVMDQAMRVVGRRVFRWSARRAS